MYHLQETPEKTAMLSNRAIVHPIATLKDEYGGIAHIIKDDGCFVLLTGSTNSRNIPCKMSHHWFKEAARALTLIISKE